ncbi:hypothetical protein ACEWY4_010954 [Coilia grayii]|uniref:Uncharacterized protein n=1 Tax=Coilia grayii TaxID=363190 RepID=A0ABD1K3D5_9TELE
MTLHPVLTLSPVLGLLALQVLSISAATPTVVASSVVQGPENCTKDQCNGCDWVLFWKDKSVCYFLKCPSPEDCEHTTVEDLHSNQVGSGPGVSSIHPTSSLPSLPFIPKADTTASVKTTSSTFKAPLVQPPNMPIGVNQTTNKTVVANEPLNPNSTAKTTSTPQLPTTITVSTSKTTVNQTHLSAIPPVDKTETTLATTSLNIPPSPTPEHTSEMTQQAELVPTTISLASSTTLPTTTNTPKPATTGAPTPPPPTTTTKTATAKPPTTVAPTTKLPRMTIPTPQPPLTTQIITTAAEQKPSPTTLKILNPPTSSPTPVLLASTPASVPKAPAVSSTKKSMVEVTGSLPSRLVDTSSLLAVLLFGLLFFVVTVVLFLTQAYESYRRKDYTQVDYLINGMYSDSGV